MSQQVRIYRMLDLSPAALTPDTSTSRPYPVMRLGDRTTEANVKMTGSVGAQHLDPVQFNLNIIGANPSASSTINTIYQKITHDTTDMSYLRLKCADWNIAVGKNILDAYVYQGQIDIATATTIAIGGEACVLGLTMSVSAGTVTGLVRGLIILMSGASMPANAAAVYVNVGGSATLTHGLLLATQTGTTLTNAIYIEQGGTVTNILKFDAISAAVVSKSTSGGAQSYTVRCAVGGITAYLRLYAD